jgi:hypothetical protein
VISNKKNKLGFPKEKEYVEGRAPTIEEIQKLLEYSHRRIKVIILTMISYGMRLGAWNVLQYKHTYNSSSEEIKKRMITLLLQK